MDVDPRTGLKIVEVPPDHANYFSSLKDTVTYWFGVVHKFNRVWDQDKRVAIFSDQCIYLCRLDGGITRCVHIRNIDRVLLGESACIGFRINSPDYDMLLQFADLKEREAALSVVKKVYHYLVGSDLVIKQLSEEANTVLQRELNLTKPQGYTVHIEPIRTQKALAKSIADQQRRELEDRKVVEMEFERIKEGLHRELMNHRTEEHDRLVEQLAKYVNELEEKNREIIRLKQDSVSRNDPELWRNCPNCARLQERLSSNSNDDKQKILKLEREIESQHHIMQHLQAAIHHRTTAASQRGDGQNGDGMADSQLVNQLRQELNEANRRNKDLQQLIAQSPMLTPEAKQRASRIGTQRDGASFTTSYTSHDWTELVNDKEREVKHLKSVLRDATFRHVQELESIRTQFQRYDEQIVDYLEKVFSGAVQPSGRGGTASQMARATAAAAKNSTTAGLPSVRSVDPYAQLSSIQASPPRAASSYPQYEPQNAQPPQPQLQQQQQPRHFEIPSASPQNPLTMQMGGQQPQPQYQDRFGGRGVNPGFSPPLEQYSPIQRSFGATPTYTPQRTLY